MILITGGTGLLGTHLIPELVLAGEDVRVLIRNSTDYRKVLTVWQYYYENAESILGKIDWFRGDITNKMDIYYALDNIEKVYHCAACVSFDRSKQSEMWKVNVQGTRNVVDMCLERKIKKLLHVSSIAAIGHENNMDVLSEENKWTVVPKGDYSKTKTLAEREVWRGIFEGLNAVIINPSIILGAGFTGQSSYRFFDTVYNGLKYYTDGVTGFVDVKDVVKAMVLLMNSDIKGERFIVNAENLSYRELFTKISNAFGILPPAKNATKFMTSFAWKAEFLISVVTGRNPRITQQTASSAHSKQRYSSLKLKNQTGFTYREMDVTIKYIVHLYLDRIKRGAS
jgi:dihydroflavonol-4-reductase